MYVRVAAFFVVSLLAGVTARSEVREFPFRFSQGLVWLDVRSEATGETFQFLLDSGAGATILDTRCARRLNLDRGRSETVQSVMGRTKGWSVRDTALTVGGCPLPDSALVVNLNAVERTLGTRLDGLIGIDFFEEHAVQLDYRTGRARIFDRYVPQSRAIVIPLRSRNSILCAKLDLNDVRSQWLRVDTGCSEAVHWAGKSAQRIRNRTNTTVALKSGSVSFHDVTVLWEGKRLGTVRAGLHANRFFEGENGLLGNGLLSRYRVTIDARNRRLILE